MANAMFGFTNRITAGTISAGSELTDLSVGNLQRQQASDANSWRTAGVTTSAAGAWFAVDAGSAVTWRAFVLSRTNLTPSNATVRWRVGDATSIIEETPLISLDLDPATFVAPTGWSFTRTGAVSTRVNSAGLIELVGANIMRWDYDPNTLALRGFLSEQGRTNSALRSAELDNTGVWSQTGVTVTADATTSPDGGTNMDKLVEDTSTGEHRLTQGITVTAAGWTFSCFIKAAERSKFRMQLDATISAVTSQAYFTVDLAAGTASVQTISGNWTGNNTYIESYGNGIYRVAQTVTPTAGASVNMRLMVADASGSINYTGTAGNGLYCWGAQAESGATLSSYVPTTSAAVGRGADTPTLTLPTGFNLAEGTFAGEVNFYKNTTATTTKLICAADDGTSTNETGVRVEFNTTQIRIYTIVASATTGSLYGGTFTPGTSSFFAGAYKQNDFAVAARTATVSTGSTGATLPPALTTIWVGRNRAGSWTGGAIRRLKYYAKRLTNAQIGAYALNGSTLVAASLAYDSGTVSAGVKIGVGQSVHVAPSDVSGQYCRCDINDAANPDGLISVGAAFAGPVWQPTINFTPQTAMTTMRNKDIVKTRSGASFITPRYTQRGWTISYENLTQADQWTQLWPLDEAAYLGANILFIPDSASTYVSSETVFGVFEVDANISFTTNTGEFRTWRGTVMERL